MGQAKHRGSFEDRVAQAQHRNAMLEAEIKAKLDPSHEAHKFRRKHGMQRLATRLVAAGVIAGIR